MWAVETKFRTLPRREKASVMPNAIASSLSRNQKAVMRLCTTDAKRPTIETEYMQNNKKQRKTVNK